MSGRVTDERTARAAWSALVEPGDEVAGTLIATYGALGAWDRLTAVARTGTSGLLPGAQEAARRQLERAVRRWQPRLAHEVPTVPDGIHLVVPGDERWPTGLDDLGAQAPACLWVRGRLARPGRWAAVVGARAATSYGAGVAYDLGAGAADEGCVVVSGGAYGIDAAAHRGAHDRPGGTVVVLAGGVDRAYPAGNARLFEAVVAAGGAIVSEVPPGHLPTRSRFLQRNRLIAAMADACVVVEAAWRSGALSTAHHAARLLRPVGAVPGPVTSASSAGCHRLLREGAAVCVTDAAELLELVGGLDVDGSAPSDDERAVRRPTDGLDPAAMRVLDALGTRRARDLEDVARAAGEEPMRTLGALGILELAGLAKRDGQGWLRTC